MKHINGYYKEGIQAKHSYKGCIIKKVRRLERYRSPGSQSRTTDRVRGIVSYDIPHQIGTEYFSFRESAFRSLAAAKHEIDLSLERQSLIEAPILPPLGCYQEPVKESVVESAVELEPGIPATLFGKTLTRAEWKKALGLTEVEFKKLFTRLISIGVITKGTDQNGNATRTHVQNI